MELHEAVKQGDIEAVRRELDGGADPNLIMQHQTPLWCALASSAAGPDIIDLLIDRGADPNLETTGSTLLESAATPALLPKLKALLRGGADPNAQQDDPGDWGPGDTALMKAVASAEMEVIDALLDAGADPNVKGSLGRSAMHCIINPIFHRIWPDRLITGPLAAPEEIARRLLDAGADPNVRDDNGATALMHYAQHGVTGALRMLLDAGLDPNEPDSDGQPAFDYALEGGYRACIEALRPHGLPVERYEWTKLMQAAILGDADAVRSALESKENIDAVDTCGRTALIWATLCGDAERVRLIAAAGADLNVRDAEGRTALHYASLQFGDAAKVRALLDAGADPDIGESCLHGHTPLMHAASMTCDVERVELLLAAGADVHIKDEPPERHMPEELLEKMPEGARKLFDREQEGQTALHHAIDFGNAACVRALLRAGADPNAAGLGGMPLLVSAARKSYAEPGIVDALLEAGAKDGPLHPRVPSPALSMAQSRPDDDPHKEAVVELLSRRLGRQEEPGSPG